MCIAVIATEELEEVAFATKCTGELLVDPAAGELTVTPAEARETSSNSETSTRINIRTDLLGKVL